MGEDTPLVGSSTQEEWAIGKKGRKGSEAGYESLPSSAQNGEIESSPLGGNGEGHRFHFTYDDRLAEDQDGDDCDEGGFLSGNLDLIRTLSVFFDPVVEEGGESNGCEDEEHNNKGDDTQHDIDSVQMSTTASAVAHPRLRSSSMHTAAEESVYFEPFEDEVFAREEDLAPQTKLSSLALSVLVFYNVSGGPFGLEPAVKVRQAPHVILHAHALQTHILHVVAQPCYLVLSCRASHPSFIFWLCLHSPFAVRGMVSFQ
jgi:hypothetical protein